MAERLLAASPHVPRFGYRRMAAWLGLGEARVRRQWRALGLNIPRRRPRRRRSGSDIRLPGAVRPNSVWSYDFVHDHDWLQIPYSGHDRSVEIALSKL